MFVADDTGTADLSYLGEDPDIRTPTIDRFATDGVRLSNYYVQPVCSPSRTSLLTGRYPIRYGLLHHVYVLSQRFGLYLNETVVSEVLKNQSYTTAMAGKWHLGSSHWGMTPPGRGFDHAAPYFLGGSEDYYDHTSSQGKLHGTDFRNWTTPDSEVEYSAYLYVQGAEHAIRAHKSSGSDNPLFLYYASQDNHAPLQAPQGYANESITDPHRRNYSGMVRIMDQQFANITRALDDAGFLNDTLVIFTTENPAPVPTSGPNATFTAIGGCNYPQRGSKHTLWGDGAAFVWGAGIPPPVRGGETKAMLHAVDLFQLVVHVAGAGARRSRFPLDGASPESVWNAVTGSADDGAAVRNETLLNYDPLATPGPRGCCGYAGLVWADSGSGRQWKLLVDPGQPDGWYPPGSSASVPPVRQATQHARRVMNDSTASTSVRAAAAFVAANAAVCALSTPDRTVPTGPLDLRGFDQCAERAAAALYAYDPAASHGADAGREEWTPEIDRLCNPRAGMHQHDLMARERAIHWGEWGAGLEASTSNGTAAALGLVGPDGFVRLGPDARIVQLFDLTSDPFQLCDVAASNPGVVHTLLDRLDSYIGAALPDGHGDIDPASDPSRHGGFWSPWEGTPPGPQGPWPKGDRV